jgi:hypothetical protein
LKHDAKVTSLSLWIAASISKTLESVAKNRDDSDSAFLSEIVLADVLGTARILHGGVKVLEVVGAI